MRQAIQIKNPFISKSTARYAGFFLLVIGLHAYLDLFSNALTDDAFITLRYVKTLLTTGTWGFLPGHTVNAVTSPLQIILLSFVGLFLGPTVNSVIWLSTFVLAAVVLLLSKLSSQLFGAKIFGYLASGALIFNPLLISTLGLESFLFIALYILSLYFFIRKDWSLLPISLGLLTLTRFDGVIFFLVALLLIPTYKVRLKSLATYLICVVPWYAFSWVYFGSALPDTFFIKTYQRAWDTWDFSNGLNRYWSTNRLEISFSFLLVPLIVLLGKKIIRSQPAVMFLLMTGLAHYMSYSILYVPPYYWYYAPTVAAVVLLGALGLGEIYKENLSNPSLKIGIHALIAALICAQAGGLVFLLARNGLPIREMPIHTNWATQEQYKEIGEWLKQNYHESAILSDGEIGTLGYYCDCYLSSFFSDRLWLRRFVQRQVSGGGVKAFLYRINFLFLDTDTLSPQTVYLLKEMPGGGRSDADSIARWETSTHWMPICQIELVKLPK